MFMHVRHCLSIVTHPFTYPCIIFYRSLPSSPSSPYFVDSELELKLVCVCVSSSGCVCVCEKQNEPTLRRLIALSTSSLKKALHVICRSNKYFRVLQWFFSSQSALSLQTDIALDLYIADFFRTTAPGENTRKTPGCTAVACCTPPLWVSVAKATCIAISGQCSSNQTGTSCCSIKCTLTLGKCGAGQGQVMLHIASPIM